MNRAVACDGKSGRVFRSGFPHFRVGGAGSGVENSLPDSLPLSKVLS